MMFPNPAYPGQSIMEAKWDIGDEAGVPRRWGVLERNVPPTQPSVGHMLSTGFSKVDELVQRLAKEYNLPSSTADSSRTTEFTAPGTAIKTARKVKQMKHWRSCNQTRPLLLSA